MYACMYVYILYIHTHTHTHTTRPLTSTIPWIGKFNEAVADLEALQRLEPLARASGKAFQIDAKDLQVPTSGFRVQGLRSSSTHFQIDAKER